MAEVAALKTELLRGEGVAGTAVAVVSEEAIAGRIHKPCSQERRGAGLARGRIERESQLYWYTTGQKEGRQAKDTGCAGRWQRGRGIALVICIELVVINTGSGNETQRNAAAKIVCGVQRRLQQQSISALMVAGEAGALIHYS